MYKVHFDLCEFENPWFDGYEFGIGCLGED